MPPQPKRSSARLLAPLALIVCALAVLIVIAGSSGGGDSSGEDVSSAQSETSPTSTAGDTETTTTPLRANYTVKPGDTLGAIAVSTGVTVETLQELNPELDPQALVAGQKIKLRE